MRAVLFPRPLVPDLALRVGEHRIRRRPHRETFVRKDDLDVHAVAAVVANALLDDRAGLLAQPVLALEAHDADAIGAVAFAVAPLHALLVGDDAGHAFAVFGVDAGRPQIG